MPHILELKDINVYLSGVQILRNINLYVDEGEIVCLVGRNGAGKTTTIKSIIGLYPVRSGKIMFDGEDVTTLPTHKRVRLGLGYSPEDSVLFTKLTVNENLSIAFWHSRQNRPISEHNKLISDIFPEIKKFLNRRSLYLSGGERKMVSISRALYLEPKILLLDEPLEGLAPSVVKRFVKGLKKINELGISLLIAESNVALAEKIAMRLYAIDRGEIIYEGDPKGIYEKEDILRRIRGY